MVYLVGFYLGWAGSDGLVDDGAGGVLVLPDVLVGRLGSQVVTSCACSSLLPLMPCFACSLGSLVAGMGNVCWPCACLVAPLCCELVLPPCFSSCSLVAEMVMDGDGGLLPGCLASLAGCCGWCLFGGNELVAWLGRCICLVVNWNGG